MNAIIACCCRPVSEVHPSRSASPSTRSGAGAPERGFLSALGGVALARRAGRLLATRLIDPLLQLLADLEEGRALRGDAHLVAGLRVPTLARLAHLDLEAAEAPDLDAVIGAQRVGHAVEDGIDDELR